MTTYNFIFASSVQNIVRDEEQIIPLMPNLKNVTCPKTSKPKINRLRTP